MALGDLGFNPWGPRPHCACCFNCQKGVSPPPLFLENSRGTNMIVGGKQGNVYFILFLK